ncbi:MAG: hypothetical protein ABSE73_19825, partial [Planctomycetota bacterium]
MDVLMYLVLLVILGIIFVLGIASAFRLLGKLLGRIFEGPAPARGKPSSSPLAVPPRTEQHSKGPEPAGVSRGELLRVLEQEVNQAFLSGRLSEDARIELGRYLDLQKGLATGNISRADVLQALEREVNVAFYGGQLRAGVRLELGRYLDKEREQLGLRTQPAPSETPAAAKAATPPVETKPMRRPEELRASIAKLHTHAQEQPAPVVAQAPSLPVAAPAVSLREPRPPDAAMKAAPQKTIFEKLATPENVRILQSLAICVIFISAVALVRTNMWSQASGWARMGLLLAGTAACLGLGFVLRRWTQLRIAGLGFLILGQLSLLLDTYAGLITPGGASLYPYSHSSLWTICFVTFSGLAFWQAGALQEPLLEAFTFFGGLAAWCCAALWAGIDEWLLPAAFVPAALLSAQLARWVRPAVVAQASSLPDETGKMPALQAEAGGTPAVRAVPRWSLPWWLGAAWRMGSWLLALAVPAAAIGSGLLAEHGELSGHYWCHALAMLALAACLLADAWRRGTAASVHIASFLLLFPAPLAAYAFDWPWQEWPVAFALPGMLLVCAGLLDECLVLNTKATSGFGEWLAWWGLGSTLVGVAWAFFSEALAPVPAFSAWAAGAGLAAALAFALLRGAAWGPWLAAVCAAFLTTLCCDGAGIGSEWWPAAGLTLALATHAAWKFLGRQDACATNGCIAADILGLASAVHLFCLTPILSLPAETIVALSLAAGWAAAAGYTLATSAWEREPWRRGLGVALLSPALAYCLYHAGLPFESPAPWLAVLIVVLSSLIEWREKNAALFHSAVCGAVLIAAHGVCLACLQWHAAEHLAAAVSFGLLGLALAVLAIRLRVYWAGGPEDVLGTKEILTGGETIALLLLALKRECFFCHFFPNSPYHPYVVEATAVVILIVAFLAEYVAVFFTGLASEGPAFASLAGQRPFHTAGGIVALLMTGWAVLETFPGTQLSQQMGDASGITASWCAALVPLFIALRHNFGKRLAAKEGFAIPRLAIAAACMAGAIALLAACRAVGAEFWLSTCPSDVRGACTLFFSAAVLVSLLCGLGLKCAFAPVVGTAGLLGLAGCAYGAWKLPPESFGICCALLVWLAYGLGEHARKSGAWARTRIAAAAYVSAAAVALFGGVYLLGGLVAWSGGHAQSWAVVAWLLLAAWAWSASASAAKTITFPLPQRGKRMLALAGLPVAAAAGLGLSVAACHAMRWANLDFARFGPGLAAAALFLLALGEVAAYFARADVVEEADEEHAQDARATVMSPGWAYRLRGVEAAVGMTALAGLCFGLDAVLSAHDWPACLTFAETALLGVALTVVARRSGHSAVLFLEMCVWVFLALAVCFATASGALNFPLSSPGWMLVAAHFLLVGMALESIVSGLAPPKDGQTVPFLASRHIAAFGLVALALLGWLLRGEAFSAQGLHTTWRALFSASALALYGSFARCSTNELLNQAIRKGAAFMAYVVLLPAGYLCLLCAHSTGSSWGALYLLALVPVLLAAAYVLERQVAQSSGLRRNPEGCATTAAQALQALLGAALVSVGGLVLAFVGNRERLAGVPCATFFALLLELLLLRAWRPLAAGEARENEGRAYSFGACLALVCCTWYGLNALVGWHAWGDAEPWAWQAPGLAALGLLMTVLGGALKLESGPRRPVLPQ